MKIHHLTFACVTLACLSACSQREQANQTSTAPKGEPSESSPTRDSDKRGSVAAVKSLNREAMDFSLERFKEHWGQCGDSWVTHRTGTQGKVAPDYEQAKEVSATTQSFPLTDIDRANGIEWRGQSSLNSKLYRRHFATEQPAQGWSDWESGEGATFGLFGQSLTKKNGKWESRQPDRFQQEALDSYEPPKCDDVPK